LLVLLSGGGSALLPAPAPGISLDQKLETTRRLMAAGADIHELNAVRRHLSRTKGGGLARRSAGAVGGARPVLVLVLSDVLGDAREDIASGPFAADPTRFADALELVRRRGVLDEIPAPVRARLEAGARGELEENPRPGDAWLATIEHRIVGSLAVSVEAAKEAAENLGWTADRLPGWLVGEARVVGAELTRALADASVDAGARAWIGGGETTVTVRGDGVGGRAQELALGFVGAASGIHGPWVLLSAGTDGRDGPGLAAGALVDSETLRRATARGLSVESALARNDASALLDATGDLLVTGPTGTNVGDLVVLLHPASML
jgi:hydroxypyruvate reductase